MKRVLCITLILALLAAAMCTGSVFADRIETPASEKAVEAIPEETSEPVETMLSDLPEPSGTMPAEALEPPVTEESSPTDVPDTAETPAAEDLSNKSEDLPEGSPADSGSEYDIITDSEGRSFATGIKSRDAVIYVTDGFGPVPDAEVTLAGMTALSGVDGNAYFEDVPSSAEAYTIEINSSEFGYTNASMSVYDTVELTGSDSVELGAINFTVSYWHDTPDDDIAMMSADVPETIADLNGQWTKCASMDEGLSRTNDILSYNNRLYAFASDWNEGQHGIDGTTSLYIYDITRNTWAKQTSISGKYANSFIYGGKIYVLQNSGTASCYVHIYNISESKWDLDDLYVGYRRGCAFFECNGYMYLGPGLDFTDSDDYGPELIPNGDFAICSLDNPSSSEVQNLGWLLGSVDNSYGMSYNNRPYFIVGKKLYEMIGNNISEIYDFDNNFRYEDTQYYAGFSIDKEKSYYLWDFDKLTGNICFLNRDGNYYYEYNLGDMEMVQYPVEYDKYRFYDYIKYINGKVYLLGKEEGADNYIPCFYNRDDGIAAKIGNCDDYDCSLIDEYDGAVYALSHYGELYKYTNQTNTNTVKRSRVSVGENHMLMIKDGRVYAKGNNTYGQLGTDDEANHMEFAPVVGLENKDIVSVEAGRFTSYAVSSNGELYAWGYNSTGQLGLGSTENQYTPNFVQSGVSNISAGYDFAVFNNSFGQIYLMGYNVYDKDKTGIVSYTKPKYICRGEMISARYRSFYLVRNGNLITCGVSGEKNMGFSNVTDISSGFYTFVFISGGKLYVRDSSTDQYINTGCDADRVFAGDYSIAYINDGKAYRADTKSSTSAVFSQIIGVSDMKELALAQNYTIGVDTEGDLWRQGVMADNTSINISSGVSTQLSPILIAVEKLRQVDSYRNQSLAITYDGGVVAWGEGYYGDGTDKMVVHEYPTRISGLSNIKQVSRGKNHNLALDQNGNVWGWGSNSNEPMGALPAKLRVPTKLTAISNVKQISGGTEYSLFLKNDGTLWGVGENSLHQIGIAGKQSFSNPAQIGNNSSFTYVSASETYAAAIADGEIYTWGTGANGQLGRGIAESDITSEMPSKVNINLPSGEYFVKVDAGIEFCLALTNKGNVWAWGNNDVGELGQGNKDLTYMPVQITTIGNVCEISASRRSAYAVTFDGKLYVWGRNSNGQLGNNSTSHQLRPVLVSGLNNMFISGVSGGDDYAAVLDFDGNLYTFGLISNGRLAIYSADAKPYMQDKDAVFEDVIDLTGTGRYSAAYSKFSKTAVFKFVPSKTGQYCFTTNTNTSLSSTLYLMNGTTKSYLTSAANNHPGRSFKIQYELTANKTYYLEVQNKSNTGGFYTLYVEEPLKVISVTGLQ